MDVTKFDTFTRSFGHRISRRQAVRTGSGVLAGLLAGGRMQRRTAHAAPAPLPPPSLEQWPVCSAERPDYCVSRYEIDGVDQLANSSPETMLRVYGTADVQGRPLNRVEWFINNADGLYLNDAMLDRDILLTIRTGRLKTTSGYASGNRVFVARTGSEEAGWVVTMTGRPGLQQGIYNGGDPEHADFAWVVCSGMLFSNGSLGDGLYVSTNATSASTPVWMDGAWVVHLSAPHFAAEGTSPDGLTHGNYSAWMSPQTVQAMGLTLAEAVAGQLAVTRTDNGVTTPVASTVEERAGGVSIDIPDLTFSSPTLRFASVKGSGSPNRGKKRKKGKKGKKGKGKGRK